jgi:hypothetical protein
VLSIPTGHENSLQVSYFRKQGQSNTTLTNSDYVFFGNTFAQGDVVAAHYTLQDIKLSWNYLTYPFPSAGAKWRIKTLWEVQWVDIRAGFDAPADANSTTTEGRKDIILPTLGAGVEYHPSRNVRFELKGSGFAIPQHANIYDAEASLVLRLSRVEVLLGGKVFHYHTSAQADQYFNQTMFGPYAGARWIFK